MAKGREIRRSMAVFTIGTVIELTDLTARQIRYYEDQGLILPKRTESNRRMYSLNDVDKLLEIKDYIDEGIGLKGISKLMTQNEPKPVAEPLEVETKSLTDEDVRRIFYKELLNVSGLNNSGNKPINKARK